MLIHLLKSKLHRASVTDSNPNYEGSLTISQDLMEAVGFLPYEKVLIGNINNGQRFETYLIAGEPGKGQICLNGATARLGKPGDILTVMSFAAVDTTEAGSHEPRMATLLAGNRLPAQAEGHGP